MALVLRESPDGLDAEEFAEEADRIAAAVAFAREDGDGSATRLLASAEAAFRQASKQAGPGTWAIDWSTVEAPR